MKVKKAVSGGGPAPAPTPLPATATRPTMSPPPPLTRLTPTAPVAQHSPAANGASAAYSPSEDAAKLEEKSFLVQHLQQTIQQLELLSV